MSEIDINTLSKSDLSMDDIGKSVSGDLRLLTITEDMILKVAEGIRDLGEKSDCAFVKRWSSIGITNIETGVMALRRAVMEGRLAGRLGPNDCETTKTDME